MRAPLPPPHILTFARYLAIFASPSAWRNSLSLLMRSAFSLRSASRL
jgi:hypothetical protein